MGRRILAITLLIAFAFPLAAPLFAATSDPQAFLPACCRTSGAHHCAMIHMRHMSGDPAFHAPPCPFYPNATTAPRLSTASLVASLPHSVQVRRDSAPPASSPRPAARIFAASANLKRGPPTHFV
jgi:hypothetical protein